MGLTLIERDLVSMTTEGPGGERDQYEILQLFPFTSEKKRMSIIVRVRTAISELVHFSHFWYTVHICMCAYCMYVCLDVFISVSVCLRDATLTKMLCVNRVYTCILV